jgi:hypothetical protein
LGRLGECKYKGFHQTLNVNEKENIMKTYSVSQVVPSIGKIRPIKDAFQKEFDDFIYDCSDEAFDEYGRYMRARGKYPRNEDEADFCEFEEAFYDQRDAWKFIREIIQLFDLLYEFKCENCIVRASCYANMTDTEPDIDFCYEAHRIRDFKVGFILFIYLKYFKTEKTPLIYD